MQCQGEQRILHVFITIVAASLVLGPWLSLLAETGVAFTPEEQQQIKSFFLHKTVTAKVDLPMTTVGSVVHWDKKPKKWVYDSKPDYIGRFGYGVRKSQRYEVTAVEFTDKFLAVSLGDGGLVTQAMVQEDEEDKEPARQQMRELRYALLRNQAHGSRIYISLGDYELDPGASKLELVRTLLAELIEMPGDMSHKAESF